MYDLRGEPRHTCLLQSDTQLSCRCKFPQGNPPGIWTSRLFRLFCRCLCIAIAPSSFLCTLRGTPRSVADGVSAQKWHGATASGTPGGSPVASRSDGLRRSARLVRYKWVAQGGRVSVLVGLPRALTGESVLGHLSWTPTTCETRAAWGFAPPPHLTETLPLA